MPARPIHPTPPCHGPQQLARGEGSIHRCGTHRERQKETQEGTKPAAPGRGDCRGGAEDEFPATKRRRAPRGRRKTPDIHVPQIPASAEATCGAFPL